jgi:PAS domain S-box-containing protein
VLLQTPERAQNVWTSADSVRILENMLESRPPIPAAICDSLGVALYTTDADGHLTYFNDAAVDLWGRRPEVGQLWCGSWRLFWLDGRPMAHDECPMAIALKENRRVRGHSAIAERPDGTQVVFEPYPSPLQDPDGRVVGGVNVLIDVTDRRRAEQALESTMEALAISSAARDDFLGLVSHELRTPVTTIFGNAQLLLERQDRIPEAERDMIGDIGADAERLLTIVENLLVLSRVQAGAKAELEPQLLRHLVRHEIDAFVKRHPWREITLATPRHLLVVEADKAYLMLLMQNLLSNADKYGGTGPIEVVIEHDGGEARIAVRDRGLGIAGIPPEKLFAPFFRSRDAQRVASGLGLGLSVCRRITEAMGGRTWASPREGGGSEFGFALPVSPDPVDS